MAYRLKTVRYQNSDRRILLQNENGPCPLLAAANALLLQGLISLPSESIRLGVASIDDVVNVLAERALLQDHHSHHLDELLQLFPKLQYGMDVNPKFTCGPTGVEFTASLTAFDMLHVDLVHGWLLDPQDTHTVELIGSKTYNELIEVVVHGNEASSELEKIQAIIKEKERVLDDKKEEANEEAINDKAKTVGPETVDKEEDMGKESGQVKEETNERKVEDDWVNVANDTADSWVGTVNLRSQKGDIRIQTVDDVSKATPEDVQEEKKTEDSKAEEANEKNVDGEVVEPKVSDSTKNATTDGEPVQQETEDAADEPTDKEASEDEPLMTTEELKAKVEQELLELKEKRNHLTTVATNGSLINTFLNATGHQLTHYGLHELYRYVQEESLCVFFRNNHFGTLTKYKGVLYLLVTDLGYANVPDVMWEKLDGIDGDTEYANASFLTPTPQSDLAPSPGPSLSPEDVLAQRGQAEADFQLALQLSKHSDPTATMDDKESKLVAAATEASLRTYNGMEEEEKTEEVAPSPATIPELPTDGTIAAIPPPNGIIDGCSTQEDSDKLLAMQLQAQMEHEDASLHLARKLQQEERERAAAARNNNNNNNNNTTRQATSRRDAASSISSNCVIS